MREIKFRAWDKRNEQMGNPFSLAELTQYEHIFEVRFKKLARFDDLVWLEYTGLKDKNGVEIYEGDIVKAHNNRTDMEMVSQVMFPGFYCAWVNHSHLFEVIGNIYENPELLK